jgi:hypothetical protein
VTPRDNGALGDCGCCLGIGIDRKIMNYTMILVVEVHINYYSRRNGNGTLIKGDMLRLKVDVYCTSRRSRVLDGTVLVGSAVVVGR